MEARQALHVLLQKGEKGHFPSVLKKKKILPLPYPEVWGESCQVMIEVLLSTGVSGQRDVSFCSRSVSCGFVTLAK